jgi:hypothetical protein
MKSWISVAFGAAALATVAFGAVTPAAARGDVGVYVGPGGLGISVSDYRYRCRDYWYRRNHPYKCGYGRYYRERYYPYYYYNDDYRYRHYHRRHHDRDRDHDWDDRRDRRW